MIGAPETTDGLRMTVKTNLLILTLVPIALALATGVVLVFTYVQLVGVQQRARVANRIVKEVFELNMVTNEYLRHPGQRPLEQWQQRRASLLALLDGLDVVAPEDEQVVAAIHDNQVELGLLFEALRLTRPQDTVTNDNQALAAFEERLTGQLLFKSHALVSLASRLAAAANARAAAIERRSRYVVTGLVIATTVLMVVTSSLVSRRVIKPVGRLHEGIEIVGTGDLDHKIDYPAKDEIGDLVVAFNGMTDALKRTKAELIALNRELDRRVKSRTSELARSNAELERSNIELQQFAYVASHDLKEPLRMVSGFCQLLASRYKDKFDDDGRKFIEFAVEGAQRMHDLIEDLLTFSRVESRARPFELTDCEKVLKVTETNLRASIEESGAAITHGTLPQVMADPSQLMQVFQNLIGNALKFHGQGRPNVRVTAERNAKQWTFCVRDNGIGIEPDFTERIFEIFSRLRTPDFSGS